MLSGFTFSAKTSLYYVTTYYYISQEISRVVRATLVVGYRLFAVVL